MAGVGAFFVGVIVGVIALAIFAVIFRRSKKTNVIRWADILELVTLLFGTVIVDTVIGKWVFDKALEPWYIIGVAVAFLPGAIVIVYRFTLKS